LKGQKRNNGVKTIDKLKALQSTGKESQKTRDSILKLLRSPGIDSKESPPETVFLRKRSLDLDSKELISPAYVAWLAGTTTLFLLGS
jgi:hypothetical protein